MSEINAITNLRRHCVTSEVALSSLEEYHGKEPAINECFASIKVRNGIIKFRPSRNSRNFIRVMEKVGLEKKTATGNSASRLFFW